MDKQPVFFCVCSQKGGVGKSTLLNKIAPDLELETGEISDSLGRGRHTTRAVSFYYLNGGKIADTPGFSSLDYEVTTSEDLNQAFPEIADVSHSCKFRTCTHTHEPACAVKPAVEREEIAPFRYEDYLQFLSEIETVEKPIKKFRKNDQNRRHYNDENNEKLHPQF